MKLIIWWCSLMIILPLFYFFFTKKNWRFLFGVIIVVVAVIGYLAPSELAYSILKTEIEKNKPPLQQLEASLENTSNNKSNSSDPKKADCENLIIESRKTIKELIEKLDKEEENAENLLSDSRLAIINKLRLEKQWIEKWGERKNSQTLLFCGEEFNKELVRERVNIKNAKEKEVEDLNIIDFEWTENNKVDVIQKKLEKICEEFTLVHFPTIWLKNIDKITDYEVKKKILEIVDSEKNSNLGEFYKGKLKVNIDLSRFSLVATTLGKNPESELLNKLKKIESFWDKYFWWIFFFSLGVEVTVFYIIIKINKKDKRSQLLFNEI